MSDSTADILSKNVSDLQASIKPLQDQIDTLLKNSDYLTGKIFFGQIPGGYGNHSQWIAADGKLMGDSEVVNNNFRNIILNTDAKVKQLQGQIDDIQRPDTGSLAIAIKKLNDYQKNSPTYQAQIAAGNTSKIIWGIIILVTVIGITIGIIIYKKRKKKTT